MRDSSSFERSVGAGLPSALDFVEAFIRRCRLHDDVDFALKFLVEELFTNMVKYNTSRGETIAVSLEKRGREVHLDLVDRDVDPFDSRELLVKVDTTSPIETRDSVGLGLHLVKSIVDEIRYGYRDRTMTIRAVKRLDP